MKLAPTLQIQDALEPMGAESKANSVHFEGIVEPIQTEENITYTDDEHEPKLHARTWIALTALCVQSFCQLFALMGPPTIVCEGSSTCLSTS
jgi:hypothetical protein